MGEAAIRPTALAVASLILILSDINMPELSGLEPRSVKGPACVKTPDVELARITFVSITLNRKRTALAVAVERGKGRKQFCAFSARARFHTGWVKTGKAQCEQMFSALPPRADIRKQERHVRNVPCVDGSELARTFFTLQTGSVLPCVRP